MTQRDRFEGFVYVWTYSVNPEFREQFLEAYRPGGTWAALFSKDPAYLGTALFEDTKIRNRFMTIDYWTSKKDRDAFHSSFQKEFETLDQACETFTLDEQLLGDFNSVAATR